LDFIEDSRTFVLADLDHDGRLEVILKNRNAPQLRILHNAMNLIGHSIAFRLSGRQSNRDAIGAAVTVDTGTLRQTKYLQAGTGFLAQHSKELFFGVGNAEGTIKATIRWPNGLVQQFAELPVNHRIEIEEGSAAFAHKPFLAQAPAFAQAGPPASLEPLPLQADTWLIDPLKAPGFSLPDRSGNLRQLQSLQGSFVLLVFFATTAQSSLDQVSRLNRRRNEIAASQLQVLAVNVDQAGDREAVQSFATQQASSLPILFATEEVAGIYNIVYRYLFDRRRDLGIPTSFLLDKAGLIVKVYQGQVDMQSLLEDVKSVPTTRTDRLRSATPFPGTLFQGTFERNDFTYGVALFQHGYLDQAAESFQQVVASKPDNPEAYYNLGTLALRRNDSSGARKYLEQTLKLRPNYPEAWNNLGMIAAQEGRPEEAIQNFQQSLELRPKYAIALLNLGNVYRRQRDFLKAEELLNHALKLEPDDPEINYSLGMLYVQQDQMLSGAEFLQRAVALRPAYPEALNNLGVLYVREQDYQKAEEQFRIGIRVAPNDDRSYLNLARLCVLRGDKHKASEVLQELLRIQPGNTAALQALEKLE